MTVLSVPLIILRKHTNLNPVLPVSSDDEPVKKEVKMILWHGVQGLLESA